MGKQVWDNALVEQMVSCLLDRGTDESKRAAVWLEENESSDAVWTMIGRFLDSMERVAAE